MRIGADGSVYVIGITKSSSFPTTVGAHLRAHTNPGGWDDILTKLAPDGKSLVFSTLYGGSGYDATYTGVVVHTDGTVYAAGMTNSANLPTTAGAFSGRLTEAARARI